MIKYRLMYDVFMIIIRLGGHGDRDGRGTGGSAVSSQCTARTRQRHQTPQPIKLPFLSSSNGSSTAAVLPRNPSVNSLSLSQV